LEKAEESPESLLVRAAARIEKAKLLLGKGADDEAGEEAWRAVVDAINAAASALWGVVAKSHKATSYLEGKIAEYIEKVWGKRAADSFRTAYGSAESLHDNFYDPRFDAKTVEANIKQAERIIVMIGDLVKQIRKQDPLHYYMKAASNPYFIFALLLADILDILEFESSMKMRSKQ
jgi:HEPN domain-containing protein